MIDFSKITVRAGNGGNGSGSFRHLKGKRYGKADGGTGGRGGNVYLEATRDINTLEPFRYMKHYEAANGGPGLSALRRGPEGDDLVIKVPVGTTVKVNSEQGTVHSEESKGRNKKLNTNHYALTTDLIADGDKILVGRGGQSGRGNAYMRDEFGRRPRLGEKGGVGETFELTLELKLLADVGLIGFPNAGKSTLLARLSRAKPQIGAYPFTTLEPNLGVLSKSIKGTMGTKGIKSSKTEKAPDTPDTFDTRDILILADIPGLIEGASEGKGLGVQFLRHIERTRVLVHLIDASSISNVILGSEATPESNQVPDSGRARMTDSLWQNYQTVRTELKTYSKDLAKKPEIIVLTKIDLIHKDILESAKKIFSSHRKKAIAISAESGEGLEELIAEIYKKVGSR